MNTSAILLAGGKGTRFGGDIPKQFVKIADKIIARYTFDLFLQIKEIKQIIVVCEEEYRCHFDVDDPRISFALPGVRRQDSVFNGLQQVAKNIDIVCIHDTARPCIDVAIVHQAIEACKEYGASVVGVPMKNTIKEVDERGIVSRTPDRSTLWEIQTPQVISYRLLISGFDHIIKHGLTVTDDVSVVEALELPVKVVHGSYANIKVTTREDIHFVENFFIEH